jgi:hypothetical protein
MNILHEITDQCRTVINFDRKKKPLENTAYIDDNIEVGFLCME